MHSIIQKYKSSNQPLQKMPIAQRLRADSKIPLIIGIKVRQKMSAVSIISSEKLRIGIQLQ